MGYSAVEFGPSMFWTNDAFLQAWLSLLIREVDGLDEPSPSIAGMRDGWRVQCCQGVNGCIDAGLSNDLSDSDRLVLIALSQSTLDKFDANNTEEISDFPIDCSSLGATEPSTLSLRFSAAQVHDIGSAFIDLLRGELEEAPGKTQWYVGFAGGRKTNQISPS